MLQQDMLVKIPTCQDTESKTPRSGMAGLGFS